jgi:hypothetical protein
MRVPLCRLLFPQRLDVFTSDPRADAALQPVASNDDDSNCAENGTFSSLSVRWPCFYYAPADGACIGMCRFYLT